MLIGVACSATPTSNSYQHGSLCVCVSVVEFLEIELSVGLFETRNGWESLREPPERLGILELNQTKSVQDGQTD